MFQIRSFNLFHNSVCKSLRKQLFKKVKCHIGRKVPKKCHVLFEWLLSLNDQEVQDLKSLKNTGLNSQK